MREEKMKAGCKRNIVAYKAKSFEDADRWDLEFWQRQTPAMRLSALVALRTDILKIKGSFENVDWSE